MYEREENFIMSAIKKLPIICSFLLCLCCFFATRHFVVMADNGLIDGLLDENQERCAILNGEYYTLTEALTKSKEGDTVEFYGRVIEEDLTVFKGVTLHVVKADENFSLHIQDGVTLTVNGKLILGSLSDSCTDTVFEENTVTPSVRCDGTIIVYGEAEVYLGVTGDGEFKVYGRLTEPFDFLDYTDENSFIGNEHSFLAIKTKRTFFESGVYIGKLLKSDNSLCVVGVDGIIRQKSGSVEFNYNGSKNIGQSVGSRNLGNVGKTQIKFSGESVINSTELYRLTKNRTISLPYNYDLVFCKESKIVVEEQTELKVLSGAEVVVTDGATLNILGGLLVYGGLVVPTEGITYPSAQILHDYGYGKIGVFKVNGKLNIDGLFAGLVQTDNYNGVITIGKSSRLQKTVSENYGVGTKKHSVDFTLKATAKSIYGFCELTTDKIYKSYAISPFTLNFTIFDKIDDGEIVTDYKLYLYEKICGIFTEVVENKARCRLPFYIGEKVKHVEVTVQKEKYFTDDNGEFVANVYVGDKFDDDFSIEYSCPFIEKTFYADFSVDEKVNVDCVFKSVKLKDDNDYVIYYDKPLQKFYAEVLFYGGKTVTAEVVMDSRSSENYSETVYFSYVDYEINESLFATVYYYKKDLDDYKTAFNVLIGGDLLSENVIRLYREYKDKTINRSMEELNFLSQALSGYIDYSYYTDIITGKITYGEKSTTATLLSIDGREEERTVLLSDYRYENGKISVTAKTDEQFYGISYTLQKEIDNVLKSKITYFINDKTSKYLDDLLPLDGKIKQGELLLGDVETDVISLYTNATKQSKKGYYYITGRCLSPFYEVKFFNATYTIASQKVKVSVLDANIAFDRQKSVIVKYTEDYIGAVKGFTVYSGDKKVAIIDLYADLSQVLDIGEYTIEPIIDENFSLSEKCFAKLVITPKDDEYLLSFGFTPGTVKEYDGRVFGFSVKAIDKKTGTVYDGEIETVIFKDGMLTSEIKDSGFYKITATLEGKEFYATVTIKPKGVTVTVKDFSYYYGDTPFVAEYTTSCAVPENSIVFSVYGETLTAKITDDNYVVDKTEGKVKRLPRPITVKVYETEKYYGDKDEPINCEIVRGSLVNFDALYDVVKITRASGETVGDYEMSAKCTFDYYDAEFILSKYRILPRPVTVTCHDLYLTYGEDIKPMLSVTDGKLAFEDDVFDVVKLTAVCGSVGRRDYGAQSINENYSVTVKPATITVFPKKITVVLLDGEKRYGDGDEYEFYSDEDLNEPLDNLVKITRQSGENVGEYRTTIERINFNYSVQAVYTCGSHSSFTIYKSNVSIIVGDVTFDFTKSYEEISNALSYEITSGNVLDDFSLNYIIEKEDCVAPDGVFGKPSSIGQYLISAETDNKNYEVEVTKGLLTVTKRLLRLKNIQGEYVYSGKEINVFDKDKNVDGLLDFDAEFLITEYFTDDGKSLLNNGVTDAGKYFVTVELIENDYYEMQSSEFSVTVHKKDVSDSLKVNLSHQYFAVVGDNRPIALLYGYNAEVVTIVEFSGEEVSVIEKEGEYTLFAYVNDKNLTGKIGTTFNAYKNVKKKIDEVSALLTECKNDEKLNSENLLKIKKILLEFSRTDEAQIEQNSGYKSIIDDFCAEYKAFYEKENEKFIKAKSVYDKICKNLAVSVLAMIVCLAVRRFTL